MVTAADDLSGSGKCKVTEMAVGWRIEFIALCPAAFCFHLRTGASSLCAVVSAAVATEVAIPSSALSVQW